MIPEIDESQLTAYALNELNAADRSQVESHFTENPDARQTVADIQATAAMLATELASELQSTPLLAITTPRRRRWAAAAIGLAAAAAMAAGIGVYLHEINKPVQMTAFAPTLSRHAKNQVAEIKRQRADPITAIPDDFGSNLFANTQHDNVITDLAGPSAGSSAANSIQSIGSTAQGPYDDQESVLVPASETKSHSRFAPISITQGQVTDNTTFRDANGNVVMNPSQGSRTLDWISNVGNAAVPGSVSVKAERQEDNEDSQLQPQLDHHLPELRFNANSLSDVIDFMRDVTGANIYMDWPALEKAGIAKDAPVTLRMTDIKVEDALSLILKSACSGPTKAGYKVENGVITISVGPDYHIDNPIIETESYSHIIDNPFLSSRKSPLSTFAVDVDTASYSNVRRFIEQGQMPPADAVRIEEMINYFPYSTSGPRPTDADPVAVNVELADCPWQPAHRLARIALKAKSLSDQKRPPSNLVFLIDVSGSMADDNKLPLLKQAIKKLVDRLTPTDCVSIVTYAGKAQMTLESTACSDESDNRNKTGRQEILDAIDSLNADGETNGGDGIQLAYKTAVAGFLKEGVNRVILATDGDFNVGIIDPTQLTSLIEKEASTGVYLTVLGVGMGNVKDSTMENLANHGKGNYAYLDSVDEADKVLGRQINATLVTVARDVKLQIEFNPATVAGYRLIGYENRAMPSRDFKDDKKSAGEMGAGHSVTALYELIPTGQAAAVPPLKYQPAPPPSTNPADHELMTISLRYQPPQGGESRKVELPVVDQPEASANASSDFRFAAAVASFGMILRNSPYRGDSTIDQVIAAATAARGEDVGGYRAQFIELAKRAKSLCDK